MEIKVVELFAGVGGFRIGLEGFDKKSASSNYKKRINTNFKVVWSNQWEPLKKKQTAFEIYTSKFNSGIHSNQNISEVTTIEIPYCDLLCGGFPCQDYSVATTLKNSGGIIGKKGVLWWDIERIVREKEPKERPKILFFENVDRLLKSPAKQKGRDFAILLASLRNLDYSVEWKVINSAEYGSPQRRKRIFIVAYKNEVLPNIRTTEDWEKWYFQNSILNKSYPGDSFNSRTIPFPIDELNEISQKFNINNTLYKKLKSNPFLNSGFFFNEEIRTFNQTPIYHGKYRKLKDILQPYQDVDQSFVIDSSEIQKWEFLKGPKKIIKTNKEGYQYKFSEGAMSFPDNIENPSRTIITGEGGKSPSRFKHIIFQNNSYRRLTPLELERLNGFPDDHTKHLNTSPTERAFLMGNALVIEIIEKIGIEINQFIQSIYETKN
jgi:DNA (cytosine-5)-methyltransferase 1